MTSYHGHKNQKDFVCVDKDPEHVPGSQDNKNGALLYHVEGQCGALPCLPYVNHRELTCAVCTKCVPSENRELKISKAGTA